MIKKITTIALATMLAANTIAPAKAHDDDVGEAILGLGSAIISTPIGMLAGMMRGGVNKGVELADDFSDDMPDNIPAKLFGHTGGFLVGTVTGMISGVFRGLIDGITLSWDDPFSTKSASLSGNFMDYDPFEIDM